MDDPDLLLLLAEIRHQAISTAFDAELLRRELVGREPTEADRRRADLIAAAARRYGIETEIAWALMRERRSLRGTLRRWWTGLRRRE